MDALTNQIRDKDARIRELEDTHGGSIDTEAIQRLKDEKKTLEGEKRSKDKELAQLKDGQNSMIRYAQKSTNSGVKRGS